MLQNKKSEKIIKNQVFNPFLPSWEYIPDGEPHVFGNRVYVYGSHDIFNGWAFCLGDYVCYSAPVTDLSSWRYEEHGFFEATSMRKFGGKYYFIYSSSRQHELCYAVSDSPTENFVYGGILISNCDFNISSYKPENVRIRQGGNNHGSVEYINGEYYVFYHRQTNKTSYSRQACAEKIIMNPNGSFEQAQISSCGLNGGRLMARAFIPRTSRVTFSQTILPRRISP